MNKLDAYKGTVWRGEYGLNPDFYIANKGKIITKNEFTSSSFIKDNGYNDAPVQLIIVSKNGKKVDKFSYGDITGFDPEYEVLFKSRTNFLIEDYFPPNHVQAINGKPTFKLIEQ